MANIEVSPMPRDPAEIPVMSFADFLLERLNTHLPALADKNWIVDVMTGRSVKYGEVEDLSRRAASALTRLGARHGDIIYFVTYDVSHLYLGMMAVWRLGAAVRVSFQEEKPEEFARQMREADVKIAVIDAETAPLIREACSKLDWNVQLVSLGPDSVEGAIPFENLLKDDGSAFPEKIEVNPREDLMVVCNTSGSTGAPKGVMQTMYSYIATIYGLKPHYMPVKSQFTLSNNYMISNLHAICSHFYFGSTLLTISKFERADFVKYLLEYKPECVLIYPYHAAWLARDPEVVKYDLSFIKAFSVTGAVLDHATFKYLKDTFPGTTILQFYGMTEVGGIAMTKFARADLTNLMTTCEFEGTTRVSSGKLFPYAQVKVMDPKSGAVLGRMQSGEIVVKAPYIMKGYLVHVTKPPNRGGIDDEGWYHTGDVGFFDQDGYLYVQERQSFVFKHYMFFVCPSDIEAVLSEHPAIREVGVVGVPNPETTSLARAFVILRPGNQVTATELETYVSQRLPSHMHLHGGVTFTDKLPINRGGKLDRAELLKIASMKQ